MATIPVSNAPGSGLSSERLTPYVPRLPLEWLAAGADQVHHRVTGTMIFADISGFTALSEQLAARGKAGAEEMTSYLDHVFGAFLADSAAYGGSLLKFGGDALLIFFSGEDHVRAGCSAAISMQATLRQEGDLVTSAGRVRLRMSMGIHSGPFDFFLVGETHRELIAAGPGATEVTRLEKQAGAGQVMISTSTAAGLPQGWLGRRTDDAVLLVRSGERAPRVVPPPIPGEVDASIFIPVALRRQLLAAVREPEHRQVAVGFIRFSGLDQLLAASGGEVAGAALHSLVSMAQRQFEAFDVTFLGTDVDADGGKLIAATGAPTATENDEERLLRALSGLLAGDHPLPLQVGAHRGRAFVGDVGPRFRRTYTLMGDVVNTAARLMAHSEPGTVLTSEEILARSSTLFAVEELPPFAAKGKARLLVPYRLGPPLGSRQTLGSNLLPLSGRDAELAELLGALRRTASGSGAAVELVAETGMGKSRLLQELEGRAADFAVLKARAQRYEASTPYHVVRQLLATALDLAPGAEVAQVRRAVQRLAPGLLPWLPLVATVMGLKLKPTEHVRRLNPERLADRVTQVVTELLESACPTPSLFVVEDAQWTDGASTRIVQFLISGVGRMPWLVCIARRPGDEGLTLSPQGTTLALEPLAADDALSLVRSTGLGQLLPDHERAIVSRAGGNPLYLVELAAINRSPADLRSLPDSVEALVSARIDRLAPEDRWLLRAASVLGTRAPLDLLAALTDGEVRLDRLAEFAELHEDHIQFRQALFQEVAYEGLSYARRRILHQRAAEIIEWQRPDEGADAEQLSIHYHAAQAWEKSWQFSRRAASSASERYAHADALAYHDRALEAGRHLVSVGASELSLTWEALGEAARMTGQLEQARRAYASARRLARFEKDPARQARLCMLEGAVRYRQSSFTQALRWYHRGLRLAQDGRVPPATVTQLKAYLTEVHYRRGNHRLVLRLADEVLESAGGAGNRAGLAMAYHMRALALQAMGDSAAIEYYEKALPLYEDLGDVARGSAIVSGIAASFHGSGRLQEALGLLRKNREAWLSLRNVPNAALVSSNIGLVLLDLGRLDEARPFLEDSAHTLKASGHFYAVYPVLWLVKLHARQGAFDVAGALLREADATFASARMSTFQLDRVRLELLLLSGQGEAALELMAAKKEVARDAPPEWTAYALAQCDRAVEAAAAAAAALTKARAGGNPLEVANALEAVARVAGVTGEEGGPASPEAALLYAEIGVTTLPLIPVRPAPSPAP